MIFLTVSNIGRIYAEDVTFRFSPELIWRDKDRIPPIFKRGIKFFSIGKIYNIYYRNYAEIVNNTNIPSIFDVEVSYVHPEITRRVNNTFHIDFMDYMGTWNMGSEIKENADVIKEAIVKLTEQVKEINNALKNIPTIISPTGLDLSITTLRNLNHFVHGEAFEKVNPNYSDFKIFREILGIDIDLAYNLEMFFSGLYKDKKLRDIEGITEDILKKMELYFDIKKYLE